LLSFVVGACSIKMLAKTAAVMAGMFAVMQSVQVAAIDPAFATNITVYHINPISMGAVPLNMDVGDATGDLFFDMFMVEAYPIECPEGNNTPPPPGHHHHGGDCSNPETYGDLVVNKLTLEVDSRFSAYAKCNIGEWMCCLAHIMAGTVSSGVACACACIVSSACRPPRC
jgi:hypothetical protein